MTTDEYRLLRADLTTRVPYGLRFEYDDKVWTMYGLQTHCIRLTRFDADKGSVFVSVPFDEALPYLRSLEDMTEAEKLKLKKQHEKDEKLFTDAIMRSKNGDDSLRGMVISHYASDWCDRRLFDHRGLIEMGLAVRAPQGFYDDLFGLDDISATAWLDKVMPSEEAMEYLKAHHSPSEVSDFQAAMNIAVMKAYDAGKGSANPFSGVSFKYNGHTWGMCARDNGVEVTRDGNIMNHIPDILSIPEIEVRDKAVGDEILTNGKPTSGNGCVDDWLEVLNDLSARVPYGVKVEDNLGKVIVLTYSDLDSEIMYGMTKFTLKPYLRPMMSMSEKEMDELRELSGGVVWKKDILRDEVLDIYYRHDALDWLLKHHFDTRGLIDRGLALEAPACMYPCQQIGSISDTEGFTKGLVGIDKLDRIIEATRTTNKIVAKQIAELEYMFQRGLADEFGVKGKELKEKKKALENGKADLEYLLAKRRAYMEQREDKKEE